MAFVGTEKNDSGVVDEAFDAAFNEALDDAAPAPAGGETPSGDEPAPGNEPAPAGDEPAPAAPAGDEPAPAPAAPPAKTPEQLELEQVKADLAALKATPAAPAPTPAPATEAPKGPSPEEVQATAEEAKAWNEFKLDFPEVAAMMEKKQATVEAQLAQALAVVKQLTDQVTPITTSIAASEDEKFVQTILTTHKDADTLLPEVEKWILTLPRHRQVGANFVLDRGSAQDVVALYTEFKVETGKVTQETPTPTPSEPSPQPVVDKADKLRKMESVSSRRTTHQEPPDSSDFDGAFNEAISSDKI